MTMRRLLALMLVLGLAPSLLPADEAGVSPRVLFLGDKGHHRPAERAAQLIPVLASRGIEVTYTEDIAVAQPREPREV